MYYDERELDKFLTAQERSYATALQEIRNGYKRSHWMWYIFPQIDGLGFSSTARRYAIKDLEQAKDYMAHPVLSKRLIEISEALLGLSCSDPSVVMGYPDDMKLCSSMTLFELAAPEEKVFGKVLDKFYHGRRDGATLRILGIR